MTRNYLVLSEMKLVGLVTCWKVLREAKMDPPIQTEYFLSGGATTLIDHIITSYITKMQTDDA